MLLLLTLEGRGAVEERDVALRREEEIAGGADAEVFAPLLLLVPLPACCCGLEGEAEVEEDDAAAAEGETASTADLERALEEEEEADEAEEAEEDRSCPTGRRIDTTFTVSPSSSNESSSAAALALVAFTVAFARVDAAESAVGGMESVEDV